MLLCEAVPAQQPAPPADLLGLSSDIGMIEPGKYADIIPVTR